MTALFYIAAVVAVISTGMVITRANLVHALLYLVVSLFAVAVVFYTMGAPFVAALEVIVYAGAIMMLFVFAVMLLNVAADSPLRVPPEAWIGPLLLVAVLLAEVVYGLTRSGMPQPAVEVGPKAVGEALYGPYVLGVELASMLLLAALIGARHVAGQREGPQSGLAGEDDIIVIDRLTPTDDPRGVELERDGQAPSGPREVQPTRSATHDERDESVAEDERVCETFIGDAAPSRAAEQTPPAGTGRQAPEGSIAGDAGQDPEPDSGQDPDSVPDSDPGHRDHDPENEGWAAAAGADAAAALAEEGEKP